MKMMRWQKVGAASRLTLVLLLLVGYAHPEIVAAATEVNTCGQTLSGSGYLSADLDCSAYVGSAVIIERGSLDLRGFTLTDGSVGGVRCDRSCTISSEPPGGMIMGGGGGIFGPGVGVGKVNIRLKGVIIQSNTGGTGAAPSRLRLQPLDRVITSHGSIRVVDSTVMNNGFDGVTPSAGLLILRSTISGNTGYGASGQNTRVIESFVTGNGEQGVEGEGLTVRDSTISGNMLAGAFGGRVKVIRSNVVSNLQEGIDGGVNDHVTVVDSMIDGNSAQGILTEGPLVVRDSQVTNNGAEGIRHDTPVSLKLIRATVTGNALHGAAQFSLVPGCHYRAIDSTITGNGTDASCGVSQTCADVASCSLPSVDASTCDTSYDTTSGFPGSDWGVCSLD
jgi:Right handed beta helix region